MISENIKILLAEDNKADFLLFKEALEELPVSAKLTIVHNGEELIEAISKKKNMLPDLIFLDLNNMPLIKNIFKNAVYYYNCISADFSQMKKVLYEALTLITQNNNLLPLQEKSIIASNSILILDKQ